MQFRSIKNNLSLYVVLLILISTLSFMVLAQVISSPQFAPPSVCSLTATTDVSKHVLKNLLIAKPFPNGIISGIQKVDEKRYLMSVSNTQFNNFNYYLYDVGADRTLDTRDDFAIFINNSPQTGYSFVVMVSEGSGVPKLYWTRHNMQTINPGFEIYSCPIPGRTCNSNFVSFIPDPYEVISLLPHDSTSTLYINIEDTSIVSTGGSILSCSLTGSPACSGMHSTFNIHLVTNPLNLGSSFKDKGLAIGGYLFTAPYLALHPFPQFSMANNDVASNSGDKLFFFKDHPVNNLTDFLLMNTTSGQISTIHATTGITPILSTFRNNKIETAYFKPSSMGYSYYIKHLSNPLSEVEINAAPSFNFYGYPINIDGDSRLIYAKSIVGSGVKIFKSSCRG